MKARPADPLNSLAGALQSTIYSRRVINPRFASPVIVLFLFVCDSIGGAVVNSTFLGGDHYYSRPENWSPAEVPNDVVGRSYNVTAQPDVYLDMFAGVSNLTMLGTFNASNYSYTVTNTATFDPKRWRLADRI